MNPRTVCRAYQRNRKAQAFLCLWAGMVSVMFAPMVRAQSLESRLDEDQFLQGLCELGAAKVLEQYIATHPTSDTVRLAQFEIARQRMTLADPSSSAEQRLAAVEKMLSVRAELIAQRSADDRRAVWLADQASDLFFELLPVDATELVVAVGVPSPAQKQRAARVAREMNSAVSQAEQEIERVLADRAPDDGAAGAAARLRQRLAEQERQRRIPYLRGVAACLQALVNTKDSAQQDRLFTQAAEDLPPLIPMLDGVAAIDARLFTAMAQMHLHRNDEAEANLAAVIPHQKTPPTELFLARMLSVMNRAAGAGPQAGLDMLGSLEGQYTGADRAFYRLIIADQRFLLRRAIAQSAPADQRPGLMSAAYSAYTDLLKSDLGVPRETLQAAVFAKLADSVDGAAPLDTLPPIVAIARADQMARSKNPQSLQDALVLLDQALSRSSRDSFERSAALFARAQALYTLERRADAAAAFLELADQSKADLTGQRAAELAASIAAELARANPDDAAAKTLLNHALGTLLTNHPALPTINRWRLAAARLALDDGRADDAIKTLSAIPQESEQWPEAQYWSARATVQRSASREGPASRSAHEQSLAAIDRARKALSAAAQALTDPSKQASLRSMEQMLRAMRAEELLALNQPQQALDTVADIENEADVDRSALAEALRVRIAAYQAMQQPEKAAAEVTRYLDAAPQQAVAVIGPMMDSLQAKVQTLVEQGQDEQAAELARRTLVPVAQIIESRLASSSLSAPEQAGMWRRIADARRLGGESAAAVAIYERLLASQPDAAPLILGRAECLYHLGGEERLAEAMNAYKRLSAAGESAGPSLYWLSQLRMLQILDAMNRNTSQIVPRIERLRQQDPAFGGERFRRGFDILRQKYTPK